MSTEAENIEQPEEPGPRCGEILAAARREQQISVDEISKELHLDEAKVRALEKNEFEALGAPVFAKGHLRKYAELVRVDIDDVITDYHQLTRTDGLPPVVSGRKKLEAEGSGFPWIAVILVLALAAGGYWYLFLRPAVPPAAPVESDNAVESPSMPVTRQQLTVEEPAEDEAEEDPPAATETDTPVPAVTEMAEPVDDGQLRLTMTFSGDCWTEITDGDGRRLFFDLGRDGRTVNVSGAAPLSLLFGNAENVSLRLNGVSYTIPDADRRGRTARFTLYGN